MLDHDEEEAIHADAYIDALLERPRGPVDAWARYRPSDDALRRAIERLAGLPRFHPSFAFEEMLAGRLRDAAAGGALAAARWAEIIRLPLPAGPPVTGQIDRRLLVGGALVGGAAIASGVSVAAAYARWQAARRSRGSGAVA